MSNDNNLLLGLALIVGAVYYTRRASATTVATRPASGPLGTGSMPGSVGSGAAQTIGGLLGNLLSPKSGGGTQTGAPPTNTAMDQFPPLVGDPVIQNSVPDADPMDSFDPTLGSDLLGSMWA